MAVSTFARNVLLFGPLVLLWGLLLLLAARQARPAVLHAPATAAVPAGPLALLTVDLGRLRGTRLGGLLGGQSERWLGEGARSACGGALLARAAEVAVAMPAAPRDGEFGVVVAGPLGALEVTGCAAKVIEARGGKPVTLREGEFWVVTDVTARGEGLVAVRQGGPLLFGGAPYVRQMMATAERRAPSVEADARHVALRSEAGDGAAVATVLLSGDLRERLGAELGRAPLGGVVGAGLSLSATDPVALRLVLGCDSAASCSSAAEVLTRLRDGEEAEPALRLLGLREPLASARIEASGPTARLALALPAATLQTLVEAALSP